MCAHVTLHFFSHRVKIEKQFGEDMLKLSRVMSGKDECGSLRRAWEQLKTGTGNCFNSVLSCLPILEVKKTVTLGQFINLLSA